MTRAACLTDDFEVVNTAGSLATKAASGSLDLDALCRSASGAQGSTPTTTQKPTHRDSLHDANTVDSEDHRIVAPQAPTAAGAVVIVDSQGVVLAVKQQVRPHVLVCNIQSRPRTLCANKASAPADVVPDCLQSEYA